MNDSTVINEIATRLRRVETRMLKMAIALNIDVIVPVIEAIFRVQFLPREVYFISELPSDVRASDVITVGLMAFGLSVLATLYPSRRAAKVQPAEALRYE